MVRLQQICGEENVFWRTEDLLVWEYDAGFDRHPPTAVALLNLAAFYRFVIPALTPDGRVTYAAFWSNYGPTPMQAAAAMASQPLSVVKLTITSGFLSIAMSPHLFLPLNGWKWVVGTAPIVALYGASANPRCAASRSITQSSWCLFWCSGHYQVL